MAARFETEYDIYMAEIREEAVVVLRVREVPLTLSGPVPDDMLLGAVDPFSLDPVGSAPALPGAPGASPVTGSTSTAPISPTANPFAAPAADDEFVTTPQAAPERIVPGADLDDEISTTPQARPERVPPPE